MSAPSVNSEAQLRQAISDGVMTQQEWDMISGTLRKTVQYSYGAAVAGAFASGLFLVRRRQIGKPFKTPTALIIATGTPMLAGMIGINYGLGNAMLEMQKGLGIKGKDLEQKWQIYSDIRGGKYPRPTTFAQGPVSYPGGQNPLQQSNQQKFQPPPSVPVEGNSRWGNEQAQSDSSWDTTTQTDSGFIPESRDRDLRLDDILREQERGEKFGVSDGAGPGGSSWDRLRSGNTPDSIRSSPSYSPPPSAATSSSSSGYTKPVAATSSSPFRPSVSPISSGELMGSTGGVAEDRKREQEEFQRLIDADRNAGLTGTERDMSFDTGKWK